jgi:hypothetical protein
MVATMNALDDHELTALWRTGPPDELVALEVWGRPVLRDALVRIIDGTDDMDAGSVTAGGTDDVLVLWSSKARTKFAESWLDQQETNVKRSLASRWGTV